MTATPRQDLDPYLADSALEAAGIGVFEIDFASGRHRLCRRARALWGLASDGDVTREQFLAAVHPDDRPRLDEMSVALDASGNSCFEIVHRVVRPDGEIRWIKCRGHATRVGAGEGVRAVRCIGAMLDVTRRIETEMGERIAAQRTLESTATRLDLATRAAGIGIHDYDVANDSIVWDDTLRRLWAIGPSEPVTYATFAGGVHPDDRSDVEAAVRRAMDPQGDGRYASEFRVRGRSDGQERWVAATGQTYFEAGRPVRMVGTAQDVTESRELRDALRQTEELTRRVTDAVPGILYVYDLEERRNVWGNREMEDMLGYTREQIVAMSGQLLETLLHPADLERYTAHLQQQLALRDDEPVDFEYRMRCANGEWLWLHSREMVFRRGRDGRPAQIVGAAMNIQEIKRAEERVAESERRLNAVLDNTTAAIFLMDDRQHCVYMNAAAERLAGYTLAETQGRPLHDVIHHTRPDGCPYPLHECPIDQAFPAQNQMQGEEVFVHRDGSFYPVAFTASPVRDRDGPPVGTVIEVRDIRAERAAAEELRTSREQLQFTLESAELGTWDIDLRTNRMNRTLRHDQFFGHAELQPDWTLATTEQHLLPEDRQVFRSAVERALQTGRIDVEVRVSRPQGPVRWLALRGRSYYDEYGRPVRMSGVIADVTARQAAVEALKEADRNKDRFLAILSHELRNPLAPIRTAAHVLAQPDVAPEQCRSARQIIQRQVVHMAGLLDDLLDLARVTQSKLELKRACVSLAEVVDAAVEAARPVIEARQHELALELPPDEVRLDADALRLAQVLSNLLNNAAKYTDPGGRIRLAATVVDGLVRIVVEDNGIGLPLDARDRLFTMFGQANGAQGRSEGGLGIGLALVKGLVDLHGGRIEAHSDGPGRGSSFLVSLPLPSGSAHSLESVDGGGAAAAKPGRRILIVDDNHDAADALAMLLRALGHEPRVAYDGATALQLASRFRPEFALLDIGMPEMDGHELARRLRNEPWGRTMHLAALTGWGQDEDRERAYRSGFDRHFTKPVDPAELEALLDDAQAC
ncbi:MAG: PAS domain S-box protein [Lysobacterales bacterium]|nr:MAG: PAS domain S-box protein [Xanthomonadales bacterium]